MTSLVIQGRSPTPRSRSQASRRLRPSLHSDCPPETDQEQSEKASPGLSQRSVSLITLQPAIVQPRMAQLETLEAKMASIEVSLSNTPRRKKLNGINFGSIRSIPKELAAKELENLRNALRDKENIIQSLRGQLTMPGLRLNAILNGANNNNNNNNTTILDRQLSDVEKKQAEERLARLKTDIENKRLAIKNLKMALERLDITDNIDVRIQQAELEYQLGREELNLLTLLEETRALQMCIEESNKYANESNSLYSCIKDEENITLKAIEVEYDPKSPKFGAGEKEDSNGLWIDWALDDTGLCKGDRLIEVNGKIVLTKSRDDLTRLLAAAPDPAQIVVLRKNHENDNNVPSNSNTSVQEVAALRSELQVVKVRADEAQKVKEGLKSDNIRLTHRISYLEEQVSELLGKKSDSETTPMSSSPVISKTHQNVTSININSHGSSTSSNGSNDVQIFQKGPQVTTLVSNIPRLENKESLSTRSKSSLSNVSNTHISTSSPQPDYHCHRTHKHRSPKKHSVIPEGYNEIDGVTYRKLHQREKDYNSETNSNGDLRYRRKNPEFRYSADFSRTTSEKDYITGSMMDQSYKKANKIVQELTRNNNKEGNLYEKHRQKCITASEKYNSDILKHYNARKSTSVIDFRSEVHIGPKYYDSRSVEELDARESPNKSKNNFLKKIQNTCSVKSLDFDSDCNSASTRNGYKSADCNEYIKNNKKSCSKNDYEVNGKSKPPPPKKPLRLSLHKTHSLQSVESTNTTSDIYHKNESRKRNHKGQTHYFFPNNKELENHDILGGQNGHRKWSNYRPVSSEIEQGTWC